MTTRSPAMIRTVPPRLLLNGHRFFLHKDTQQTVPTLTAPRPRSPAHASQTLTDAIRRIPKAHSATASSPSTARTYRPSPPSTTTQANLQTPHYLARHPLNPPFKQFSSTSAPSSSSSPPESSAGGSAPRARRPLTILITTTQMTQPCTSISGAKYPDTSARHYTSARAFLSFCSITAANPLRA